VTAISDMNRHGIAVGYYKDARGVEVPFRLNTVTEKFAKLTPPGALRAEAAGVDGRDDIAGFLTTRAGVRGFLFAGGSYAELAYPGAAATRFFDVAGRDGVVGSYIDKSGAEHGLLLRSSTSHPRWRSLDMPGASATVASGINGKGEIVGWFVDAASHHHGFFCGK